MCANKHNPDPVAIKIASPLNFSFTLTLWIRNGKNLPGGQMGLESGYRRYETVQRTRPGERAAGDPLDALRPLLSAAVAGAIVRSHHFHDVGADVRRL